MLRQQFLQEIQASTLMIHSSGFDMLTHIFNSIINGTFQPEIIEQTIVSTRGEIYLERDEAGNQLNPFDDWSDGSVAIIPLVGIMMKYGYWWSYGVDDIARIIRLAYQSDRISAVIVKGDTPGGSVDSLYLIQQVLSEKTKPTYGFIDGMCASCAYIAFSYMDKVYAINRMACLGGIGVLAQMLIPNKENAYYQVKIVYPEESKDKNKAVRDLIEKGDDTEMKKELSKLAVYFQEIVKANRADISDDTLTGKIYYAYEAESLGMIDGIRTLEQTVEELESVVAKRKEILSII
jgi:protease-4